MIEKFEYVYKVQYLPNLKHQEPEWTTFGNGIFVNKYRAFDFQDIRIDHYWNSSLVKNLRVVEVPVTWMRFNPHEWKSVGMVGIPIMHDDRAKVIR